MQNIYRLKIDSFIILITLVVAIFGIISNAGGGDLWTERIKYIVVIAGALAYLLLLNYRLISKFSLLMLLGNLGLMIIIGAISVDPIELEARGAVVCLSLFGSYCVAYLNVARKIFYPVSLVSFAIISIMVIDYIPLQLLGGGYLGGGDAAFLSMSSENAIGSWLVTTAATLIVVSRYEKNSTPLWPAIISLVLSVGLYTRANIVLSGALLVVVMFFDHRYKTILALVLFYIIFYFISGANLYHIVFTTTRFADKGLESARYLMWKDYIAQVDFLSLFFGLRQENIPIIASFQNNPHSSLIRLFHHFGLYPFIVLVIWVIARKCIKFKFDHVTVACLLIIIARSMTDVMFVGQPLDMFFFVSLLIFLRCPGDFGTPVRFCNSNR
ncbi:MAG: hypothetical protein GQF41_0486 [Candidatus Rifleibacterium amylolyticum]|nr:MAG: hypothetical protein GQF41_0486 [Candidatus Rifleibacterium amylolyticum]